MANIQPVNNPHDPERDLPHSKKASGLLWLRDSILFLGLGLGFVYWLLAALISKSTAQHGTFIQHFFNPAMGELLNRLLVLCFFIILGSRVSSTIRQRQRADQALVGSEEKHRAIIENIEDGYYEIDLDGRFLIFNDSFRKITGYSAQQLRQLPYRRLLTPAETGKVIDAFEKVKNTGRAIKYLSFVIVRQDGFTRWVETSVSPITGNFGETLGYRGLLRDVTARRQADALKQEKMAAEAASRSKSEFLANMSHEIRTPLNAIIGFVEILLGSSLNRDQREDLEVVQSAAYALLSVINDVLDFSKIEAGKLELERLPFNLRNFLGEALKILAVKAHEKNLELAYRVAPDVPDRLVGDRHRFRQVLLNLIGNALKFTEKGEIVVFARCKEIKEDRLLLHVAVKDTGAGIPTGKQALIFESFRQADGSIDRKYGGTGLGLAVSTQLVNLMGGRIGVRSELGKGSIFHFTIAFDVAPGASDGVVLPDDVDLNGLLILVVDDNATNLKILCEMLTSWKINPKPASSVTAGAAMIRKLNQHGKKPHLAIIDSDLPQSDALSLVRQIRQENAEKTGVIAMLTTTTTKETDRFYEAGAGAVLTKPVRPSELLDAIIQVLSMAKAPVDEREGSVVVEPEFSLTSMNVLVAEDTPFNQKYIRRLLDNWGSKTTIVSNGRQAVEMLADREFDIVLMDVQMPEMDGLTATARIRRLEKQTGRHVPIIAMTAHAMQGDRERCLEAGMDDYVPKPISSANLKEAIQRLAPAGTQAAVPAGAADAPAAADEPDELKALLEAFDNDSSLFQEIAGMFISDYPTMLETIQEAIAEQDGPLLGLTAHALKGIARNFQVDGAADAALHLEALARQEQFIKAREVCRQLTGELTAFENRLKRMMDRIAEA